MPGLFCTQRAASSFRFAGSYPPDAGHWSAMPSQSLVAVGGKVTAATTNTTIANTNAQGMTSVVASSATGTGVTLATNGVINFTSATSVVINGCFTSTCDTYLIKFRLTTSASANVTLLLGALVNGHDAQFINGSAASTASNQTLNGASWVLPAFTGAAYLHYGSIELESPALAAPTSGRMTVTSTPIPMTTFAAHRVTGLLQNASTAVSGMTLAAASGTISGYALIYGYNNNT